MVRLSLSGTVGAIFRGILFLEWPEYVPKKKPALKLSVNFVDLILTKYGPRPLNNKLHVPTSTNI